MNHHAITRWGAGLLLLCFFASCDDSDEVSCNENFSLSVTSQSPAHCENTGSVTVAAQNPSGTVLYRLGTQMFQNSGTFNNLEAGTYQITAQDENNCETTLAVTVDEEASDLMISSATTSPTDCLESDGTLTVVADGGNPQYQYRINEDAFQSEAEFTALAPGEYTVTVQDADGCLTETTALVMSNVSYSDTIQAIINTNCAVAGCHVAGQGIPNWSDKSNVIANASDIKARTTSKSMPPPASGLSLTDDQIALIACWVDDGAQDN
uniref:SprB repeat-containing protein n=1 Tax=Roseihalotalea indica TaxID=2867963 RepID=A0AA49GPX7_9BACT|nr:hypothetical protein K4G66_29935 [Tunicatimonas sp. TK19036]